MASTLRAGTVSDDVGVVQQALNRFVDAHGIKVKLRAQPGAAEGHLKADRQYGSRTATMVYAVQQWARAHHQDVRLDGATGDEVRGLLKDYMGTPTAPVAELRQPDPNVGARMRQVPLLPPAVAPSDLVPNTGALPGAKPIKTVKITPSPGEVVDLRAQIPGLGVPTPSGILGSRLLPSATAPVLPNLPGPPRVEEHPAVVAPTPAQVAPAAVAPAAAAAPTDETPPPPGVHALDTPEVKMRWTHNGRLTALHTNSRTLATSLMQQTHSLPTSQRAAFQAQLQTALQANIARGTQASRTVSVESVDDHGDRRVYTYDIERAGGPHLLAAGVRFATEAGRTRLAGINTPEKAYAYADQVIANIDAQRKTEKVTGLTTTQRLAIKDNIFAWFNVATHHEMPVNPVLRVIDDGQVVTSTNRAININLETGHEQFVWSGNRWGRYTGLTSSTKYGDTNGDDRIDVYSNIVDRKAFELGLFNLHLYNGNHQASLQQDGVNAAFSNHWDIQQSAMHRADYVSEGPPVRSGRSWMCDAVPDTAASYAVIEDLNGGMMGRYSVNRNAAVERRYRQGVQRQDYDGALWRANDDIFKWGAIPQYAPARNIYPDQSE